MKKLPILVFAAMALTGCHGIGKAIMGDMGGPMIQGSGKAGTQTFKASGYTKIVAEGAIDVEVQGGQKGHITATADDNLLSLIKCEVVGDTLRISAQGNYSTKLGIKVKVPAEHMTSLQIEGSGDAFVHNAKESSIELAIRGSGSITADGKADKVQASIEGSGDLKLYGLTTNTAEVTINGSGAAEVDAASSLKANVNGSGDIRYKGKPQVEKNINGSGDVSSG